MQLFEEIQQFINQQDKMINEYFANAGVPRRKPIHVKPKPVFKPIAALAEPIKQPVKAKPVHQQRKTYVAKAGEIIL